MTTKADHRDGHHLSRAGVQVDDTSLALEGANDGEGDAAICLGRDGCYAREALDGIATAALCQERAFAQDFPPNQSAKHVPPLGNGQERGKLA